LVSAGKMRFARSAKVYSIKQNFRGSHAWKSFRISKPSPINKETRQRRTAAKLFRSKGGELEQIQFLLGHESILTTERYLGSEQDLKNAVNDAVVFELRASLVIAMLVGRRRPTRSDGLTAEKNFG
jgi:integrase